jgi:hypothetical protein
MCRGAFASGRIACGVCVIFARPALRRDDALHRASAKTGWVGSVRLRTDHQEENLRAAGPIRAVPPLFAFVLHERDLRSFQRAASMHLFVACALIVPGGFSDRGVCVHRNRSLPIIWLSVNKVPSKKMLSAHDYDRHSRGWFPSQILGLLRRRGTPSIGACSTPVLSSAVHYFRYKRLQVELSFDWKNGRFECRFASQIDVHFNVIFRPH